MWDMNTSKSTQGDKKGPVLHRAFFRLNTAHKR
jgi:hypothetical protein